MYIVALLLAYLSFLVRTNPHVSHTFFIIADVDAYSCMCFLDRCDDDTTRTVGDANIASKYWSLLYRCASVSTCGVPPCHTCTCVILSKLFTLANASSVESCVATRPCQLRLLRSSRIFSPVSCNTGSCSTATTMQRRRSAMYTEKLSIPAPASRIQSLEPTGPST